MPEFMHTRDRKDAHYINFDSSGVCEGCQQSEKKENIDWTKREEKLIQLCDKYRKKFISIVEKSGVGESDVEEFLKDSWLKPSPSAKKIMGFVSLILF